jgi:RNA-dependent RNA polymerase
MTDDNKYCFTDGIGKISASEAREICKKYFGGFGSHANIKYASTFQIRFAGFKGVLSAWPDLITNQIQFRPSMNKFSRYHFFFNRFNNFNFVNINKIIFFFISKSGHNRLDVLNAAEYIPCYLNRQVILILSA